jgi:hypothetical protein
LSEDFESSDVRPLADFIASIAPGSIDGREYLYPSPDHIKAEVTFWMPKRSVLECLTLGYSGDLNCIDVTGDSSTQIKGSLMNAAGAFDWDMDDQNINLIAMEIDNSSHDNIDVGDACSGDEASTLDMNKGLTWYRDNNGFFNDPNINSKVAGVIAVRRREHLPVSRHTKLLFINERFRGRLEQIYSVIAFDRVIFFNELIHDE